MDEPYDYAREDHVREVERALMYIAEAQRKAEEIADGLAKADAEEHLVVALRTAATALRAEHNRLLNQTHFPVPTDSTDQPDADQTLIPDDAASEGSCAATTQQRMAL